MISVKQIAEFSGHQNPIFTVENSQKPHIFFTAGNDKGVVEWSMKTMALVKVLMPVKTSVYALHAPEDLPILAVGERSGNVSIFDFGQQKVVHTINHHQLPVFDIRSVKSKQELLVASEDSSVSVWSMDDFKFLYKFPVSGDTVRVIAISPNEKYVAFGCKDNIIRVYNLEDYSLLTELRDHTMPIISLQFSPNGMHLLSGSRDAQLKIWNTADFGLLQNIPAHLFTIYDIKYHPVLNIFATASRDKSIKIWDADDFRLYKIISREKGFPIHRLSINKIAWSSYNGSLLSVGDDKLIMAWEVKFTDDNA
ncbi:MAG TPA: WD40 repeat domain-containing protein [Sphingobacteriaceae bacterium]|nr:WD40 repeat domain-containing protein [Sphingobacteriaceae bacterium]